MFEGMCATNMSKWLVFIYFLAALKQNHLGLVEDVELLKRHKKAVRRAMSSFAMKH